MPTNADVEAPVEIPAQSLTIEVPPLHFAESEYTRGEDWAGESVSTPILAQLRALGFSDRQLRTLSRLSVETQNEVYTAVVTLMLSDDPVLDDFLGTV